MMSNYFTYRKMQREEKSAFRETTEALFDELELVRCPLLGWIVVQSRYAHVEHQPTIQDDQHYLVRFHLCCLLCYRCVGEPRFAQG